VKKTRPEGKKKKEKDVPFSACEEEKESGKGRGGKRHHDLKNEEGGMVKCQGNSSSRYDLRKKDERGEGAGEGIIPGGKKRNLHRRENFHAESN